MGFAMGTIHTKERIGVLEERILSATEAHNEAMGIETTQVVARLIDLLGASTVARIGNVTETRAVQQWLSGEREPQRQHALRFAFQLASMIRTSPTGTWRERGSKAPTAPSVTAPLW
jgi:hypothetical protein